MVAVAILPVFRIDGIECMYVCTVVKIVIIVFILIVPYSSSSNNKHYITAQSGWLPLVQSWHPRRAASRPASLHS